jgi:hypothetical protein
MKTQLRWMTLLLLVCWMLFTAGLNYGQPSPEYAPSTFQNGWLNGATIYHPDSYDYVGRPYSWIVRKLSPLRMNFYHNPSVTGYFNMFFSFVTGVSSQYRSPYNPTAPLPEGTNLDCESGNPPRPQCLRQIAPFSAYVVGRFISASLMLLVVAIAYTAGRTAFDWRVGLLAACMVGLCPMVAQNAHYEMPGAPTLFFTALAVWLSLLIFRRPQARTRLYVVAGLAVGLAASSRYNAGVIGVLFAVSLFAAWRCHHRLWPLVIGLFAVPVGFVIGTPGSIFEARFFLESVQYILYWYNVLGGGPGWTTGGAGQSIFYNWRYVVIFVIGPLAGIAALAGMARFFRQRRSTEFWIGLGLALFFLVYSLTGLSSKRLNANLLIPLIVPLALLASVGFFAVFRRLPRVVTVGLGAALVAWPAYLSVLLATFFIRADTRLQAQAWLYQHIPKATPVYLLGSYNVPVDPLVYPVKQVYGGGAPLDDPLWSAPVIVYSDAYPRTILRDPSLTPDPKDVQNTHDVIERLKGWKELARFDRLYWPGQDAPPDDVSFWHQPEIIIYCNPANCPAG